MISWSNIVENVIFHTKYALIGKTRLSVKFILIKLGKMLSDFSAIYEPRYNKN